MKDHAGIRLKLENVTKAFPGVKALDQVSFEVRAGEVHGLVGENGAGKSTLMGVASGALTPEEGLVEIDGVAAIGDPKRARELGLAIVRQEPSLMPHLTVAENLFLGAPAGLRPAMGELGAWTEALLRPWNKFGALSASDLISALNPEQRFVVEIVKAFACKPKVLVLDEPTEHLPSDDVERLFERVRAVAETGCAVVYISHRIREVRRIAQRVTVLRDGANQGTFDVATLNEQQIVELIVGGALDYEFPEKASAATGDAIIETRHLQGWGFRNVCLCVGAGRIVGLAGVEGNGQREFLRGLAGLEKCAGEALIGGQPARLCGPDSAWRAGVGYLPGDRHRDGIFAELSVAENFALRSLQASSRFGVVWGSDIAERTRDAVAAFNVKTPSIDTPVCSLSGGNQQKLILASVLAAKPVALLIDEPTQGVDVGARAEIYRLIRRIAAAGAAVLMVSSDSAELAGLCDEVVVFSRGEAVCRFAGADVTENQILSAIVTSTQERVATRRAIAPLWRWAAGNTAPIVLVGAAVFALGVYASTVSEYYLTTRNLGGVLAQVATLAFVAYGQQIVMLLGEIDLSVGPVMGLCVIVGSFFLGSAAGAGSIALGFVLMLAAAAAVGLVNFLLVDRLSLHPMIATLATYMGVQAVSLVLRPAPAGLIGGRLMKAIATKFGFLPLSLVAAALVGLALEFVLMRTNLGFSLRGLGSRPEAARVAGIRPRALRAFAYVSCAIFAALAAVPLLSQVGIGDAKAGLNYTLSSIAAVVIGGGSLAGGRGSFLGALLGGLLINQVNVVSTFLQLSDAWSFYLQGGMVLAGVALYSRSRQIAMAN
jgi:ribose transport system ATP-binding protein